MKTTKNNYKLICLYLMVFAFVGLSACSKDSGTAKAKKSGISMKVNGEPWSSAMTTLFTEEHENDENQKYYLVSMMGTRIIEKNSTTEDDGAESITLYIAIPASKFQNPKGVYPIVWQPEAAINEATAVFGTSTDIRDATTYAPATSGQSGTIEISGFEIGQQQVMGHPTGTEGYVKLSGVFKMDLSPLERTGNGGSLKITDGQFNLAGGMQVGL